MEVPKLQVDQITQGSGPTGAGNPLTSVGDGVFLDGPMTVGLSPTPVPIATVSMGPPTPQLIPTVSGLLGKAALLTENKIGIFNGLGTKLMSGLTNMLGLKSHLGLDTQTGLKNQNGLSLKTGLDLGMNQIAMSGHVLSAKKNFDIPHPTKSGHRLRYVCTETPEAGVYIRGKSKSQVIELPDYWKDLVYEDSITVSLTPVGSFQYLYVQSIEDNKITVGGGLPFNGELVYNYHYTVFAERKDCERNIAEYEGETPKDYPGDSSQCSVAGWDY